MTQPTHHKAEFWSVYDKDRKLVKCELCPKFCIIKDDEKGFCKVRKNINGELFALVYGKLISMAVDPMEKKPLFHFMPGTPILSISTVGCNLGCLHCQNWEIARGDPEEDPFRNVKTVTPEEIVDQAKIAGCKSIAYTYVEPTIFYEYIYDTAKLAKKAGIKNVMVTNGFINPEPLKKLYPYIDAANIDLKGFTKEFYRQICAADLEPVLNTIKTLKELGTTHMEITNLLIPTKNDDPEKIKEMCEWIKDNVGTDVPLHFSKFSPMYKLSDLPPTPEETIHKARDI
ncbi:AmmeMemoRadiSam system radical SAM enzyme, partial [Nanoarchaeota archaeon]